MLYAAHAGILLSEDLGLYQKDIWYSIKLIDDIEYRWRLTGNLLLEVLAGTFCDKRAALKCAKKMYVSLLYLVLRQYFQIADAGCAFYGGRINLPGMDTNLDSQDCNDEEPFFYWNSRVQGGLVGPGVYEIEAGLDDFNRYKPSFAVTVQCTVRKPIDFGEIDEHIFIYNREAQRLLNTIIVATSIHDIGMEMTLFCGLLEHLSESGKKDPDVIREIENLIEQVKNSELEEEKKRNLVSYLSVGKELSARQRCLSLLKKYAKSKYGLYSASNVFDEAYSIRSTFSHGEEPDYGKVKAAAYMRFLMLDVIKGYLQSKEDEHA